MPSKRTIQIYDTTLRDGSQQAGLSLSVEDKLRIAKRLDRIGVTFIEGGWPGSNPKDVEFFQRLSVAPLKNATLVAFGSTRKVGASAEDDLNLRALLKANTRVCTLVGKSWTLHVTDILRTELDENLKVIADSIGFVRAQGRRVIFDAEHFFHVFPADAEYALQTVRVAAQAGAETVVLCDTNGGALPWEIERMVRAVQKALHGCMDQPPRIGIHTHDDSGCATANALAAVQAGADHLQGTINGYGERCGNANLCELIPNIELKLEHGCLPDGELARLTDLSLFVAETVNQTPKPQMAYVGRNAFAHKGGIHVAAMRRNPQSYQHVDPVRVGNRMRSVVSELSGRGNLLDKAEEFGVPSGEPEQLDAALAEIKANEARGFSYEAAGGSVALMLVRQAENYQPPYRLIDYMVNVEHRDGRGTFAEATVKVEVMGQVAHTAAEGDGPVSALDRALRKALLPIYPQLEPIHLQDYKVRILDGGEATAATTRVLILTSNGKRQWGTVGASSNIIDASWRALTDAIEFGLWMHGRQPVEAAYSLKVQTLP